MTFSNTQSTKLNGSEQSATFSKDFAQGEEKECSGQSRTGK